MTPNYSPPPLHLPPSSPPAETNPNPNPNPNHIPMSTSVFHHQTHLQLQLLPPIPLLPSPTNPTATNNTTATKPRSKTPSPLHPHHSSLAAVLSREEDGAVVVDGVDEVVVVNRAEKGAAERGSRVVTGIVRRSKREAAVRRAGLGLRAAAVVLSLISFSVMAADKTKGWAGDSFERYMEYRFCITVNIFTFVYSSFQAYAYVHHIIKGKHIIRTPIRYYFDLGMDQILAYLLISSSTAAATINENWVSNWGKDPFTVMINGSVSMSFLAFVSLALSSLISAHEFFSRSI